MTWHRAWVEGRTPWDAGDAPPVIRELVSSGTLPQGRALVPGCGSGYDVLALASDTRHVTGLEVSPEAVRRFEQLRDEAGVSPDRAGVVVADFFEWEPADGRRFDLIWDYTFLCAIDPEQRGRWAQRIDELLAPEGELITLIFPVVDRPRDEGPPYPMDPELVGALLSPRFEPVHLAQVERSHPSRQGKEWLGRWRRAKMPSG